MEERSSARNVPRSGLLTMSVGCGGGGGGRLFQIRAVLGKMSFYGNLPSGRRRNTCVSMRVDVIRETDIDDFVFNLEKKKKTHSQRRNLPALRRLRLDSMAETLLLKQ